MTQSNDTIQDNSHGGGTGEQDASGGSEQQYAGSSGEGAASALAQLKTQTRQHRRLVGDGPEDASEGPGQ